VQRAERATKRGAGAWRCGATALVPLPKSCAHASALRRVLNSSERVVVNPSADCISAHCRAGVCYGREDTRANPHCFQRQDAPEFHQDQIDPSESFSVVRKTSGGREAQEKRYRKTS